MSTKAFRATLAIAAAALIVAAPAAGDDHGPLDHAAVADVAVGQPVHVEGLALSRGAEVDLRLERFDVLAPDATLVVAGADGERPLPPSDLVLLRGQVVGDPASRVFFGISSHGTHGVVRHGDGGLEFVTSGAFAGVAAGDRPLHVTSAADLPQPVDVPCGVDMDDDRLFPLGRPAAHDRGAGGSGGALSATTCLVAAVAVDTDWEFTGNLFGGDTGASADYAVSLIAAVGEIFEADIGNRLLVTFLRVWSSDGDPYSPGGGDLLQQFRGHWATYMDAVPRTTAHMLSGRNDLPYGGVAYLGVLCSTSFGYGLSGHLNGSFPYPLEDHSGGNWDLVVVAHELGHNFGTGHTHDSFTPPIDGCGIGDCSGAADGTIMSYCHTCAGGISNIALTFHPLVQDRIHAYLDSGECDITAEGASALTDTVQTYADVPREIDVLLNDTAASCDPVMLTSFDAVTFRGGTTALVPADPDTPRDRILYTPPAGFSGSDVFGYEIDGGATAMAQIVVKAPRAADATGVTAAGATIDYYVLQSISFLPDFDILTPYATDVTPDVDFASTGGAFATSGRADDVGAVFEGYVTVPEAGLYTLFTNSDDGSALYLGDELVVSNDGTHPMRERSGSRALEAGSHAVRVEFFERGGGAGLIVSIDGPDLPKQPIPPSMWSHEVPCGADLDANGTVGFGDLLLLLTEWGTCVSCPADFDQSGAVDFQDLLAMLVAWGPC
jgi:hypothetical protein